MLRLIAEISHSLYRFVISVSSFIGVPHLPDEQCALADICRLHMPGQVCHALALAEARVSREDDHPFRVVPRHPRIGMIGA
jgi:hypothetical protein